MQRHLSLALAVVGLTACGGGAGPTGPSADVAAPPEYSALPLGHLGDGTQGWGIDINNRNQVVGVAYTTASTSGPYHAFFWENGVMQDLGTLGGANSYAEHVNEHGQVVGWSYTADGALHAFFWEAGAMQDLGPVAVSHWQLRRYTAVSINERGQVIGNRPGGGGFLWQGGVTQELPLASAAGINDHGQVVGSVMTPDTAGVLMQRAALWDDGVVTQLGTIGGRWSYAVAISNSGWVAGTSEVDARYPSYYGHAFRWRDGQMQDLGRTRFNEPNNQAVYVTDRGQVLVTVPASGDASFWDDGVYQAVTWELRPGAINHPAAITGRNPCFGALVWQDGVLYDLDGANTCGDASDGIGVNDGGVVAGMSGDLVAVIWMRTPAGVASLPQGANP
jgi:probable HAF family extracellular repeat protein